MFPCPECRSTNTKIRNKSHLTLWPYPKVTKHIVCKSCGTHFQTVEVMDHVIKAIPKLKKKRVLSRKHESYGYVQRFLSSMEVGDYVMAKDKSEAHKLTQSMIKLYGPGHMRIRKSNKSEKYVCQRIK